MIDAGYLFGSTTGYTPIAISYQDALVLWVIGIVVTLMVAQFLAFCKVRKERNDALALLDNKPDLQFRGLYQSFLTDPRIPENKYKNRRIAWYYDVSICNKSPKESLGVRSIILEVTGIDASCADYVQECSPYCDEVISDFGDKYYGDIPGNFLLKPNEVKSGILLFVECQHPTERHKRGRWDSTVIIITNSQGKDYRFPIQGAPITRR